MSSQSSAYRVTTTIPAIVLRSRARLPIAITAVAVGVVVSVLVIVQGLSGAAALTIVALPLTLPVAVAKSATGCGMNALGTFSNYDSRLSHRLAATTAYVVAATLTAALVGLALALLGGVVNAKSVIVAAIPICIFLGLWELGFIPNLRAPSRPWQVPFRWVRNTRVAPLVWGVFLGSGFSTQMPHPSYYGLWLAALVLPAPYGIAILATYGLARSAPALAAAVDDRFAATSDPIAILQLRLFGTAFGGMACLLLAGGMLGVAVSQVGG